MFQFVHITHLDDVRHAISEDFFLAERDWGYVINYHINAFPEINDSMTDEEKALEYIRREFRGIKFAKDGTILARPFHKFFNWGEKEAEMAQFDFNQPFVIMDKLDGSMIHPYHDDDCNVVWCSKMGPTDVAVQAAEFVQNANAYLMSPGSADDAPDYLGFVNEWLFSGWTPIFEWCSRKQRIVVDYPEDQLILTAIRNQQTGSYLSMEKMRYFAARFNIPVVKTWQGNFQGIDHFLAEIGGEEQCEGYIIRFENGHMVKLKNAWYLNLHRAKDQLSNEKNVYRLVLSEHHDDLLPQLDPDTRRALENFATDLSHAVKIQAATLANAVAENWKHYGNRRDFALNFGSKQELSAVVFKILDGKDAYEALVDWLLAQTSTQAKLDAAKAKFGQITWSDYYYAVDMEG